jgi:hypothetical protein
MSARLAEIGDIRVASARYARTLAAAAGRVERSPELLAVLLAWLSDRLGKELRDSAPFFLILSDLLGLVAAAAERMPEELRRSAGKFPQLDHGLRDAVHLHDTFTGRRAAFDLLALRGRFNRETAAALQASLRDVPELQDCALKSLSRFRETEPGTLDDLLEDPSILTVYAATSLATSLAASGSLQPHERNRLSKWAEESLQDTGSSAREVWTLRLESGIIRPVFLGRLGGSLSHLLLELPGVSTPGFAMEDNK